MLQGSSGGGSAGLLVSAPLPHWRASSALDQACPLTRRLWNKLGATQANSAQSEDSLHSYHQALETRPNYVRAWINVGMSFVNQGNYNDACQYYLRGLNLNPEAVHVWNYLRTALSLLDRMVCATVALLVSPFADASCVAQDLVAACDSHDLEAFKGEFDFA